MLKPSKMKHITFATEPSPLKTLFQKNYLRQSEVRNIDRARNEYREILKKAKNHATYYSNQGDGERAIPSKLPKLKIHSTKKLTEKNSPEGNTDLNKLSIL